MTTISQRLIEGRGIGACLSGNVAPITELLADAHDEIASLRETLRRAREKLMLYRKAHGGEYVGGMEYSQLMRQIDAALAR